MIFRRFGFQNPFQDAFKILSKKTHILASIFYRLRKVYGPSWWPSWIQLGAILGQLGSILGIPGPAKIGQNRPGHAISRFPVPRWLQEHPEPLRTSIFNNLGVIFLLFGDHFFYVLVLALVIVVLIIIVLDLVVLVVLVDFILIRDPIFEPSWPFLAPSWT